MARTPPTAKEVTSPESATLRSSSDWPTTTTEAADRRGSGRAKTRVVPSIPGEPALEHQRPAHRAPDLGRAQHLRAQARGGVEHAAARAQHLAEALLRLTAAGARRGDAHPAGVRGDRLGAGVEIGVHALVEIGAQAQVDEQPGAHEHDDRRQREEGGEAHADGQAAHGMPPSLRSR